VQAIESGHPDDAARALPPRPAFSITGNHIVGTTRPLRKVRARAKRSISLTLADLCVLGRASPTMNAALSVEALSAPAPERALRVSGGWLYAAGAALGMLALRWPGPGRKPFHVHEGTPEVCVPGPARFVVGSYSSKVARSAVSTCSISAAVAAPTCSVRRLRGGRSIRSVNAQPWSPMRTASNDPGSVSTTCIT
jgi:hypothetical protein